MSMIIYSRMVNTGVLTKFKLYTANALSNIHKPLAVCPFKTCASPGISKETMAETRGERTRLTGEIGSFCVNF